MLEQDIKKPKKEPCRMPSDFRLVDFHKPLMQQAPVIFFICAIFVTSLMILSIVGYEGMH